MNRLSAANLYQYRDRLRSFAKFLWRQFRDDRCFEAAGTLSFTSLFAIVPLLAAMFAMLSVFPVFAELRDRLSNFIFHNFVPAAGETVQGYLLLFAGNASRLTVAGVLVLLVSALLMMASIEERFNRIWRVPVRRKGGARFLLYWAALSLGPLLVVAGVAASSWMLAQPLLHGAVEQGVFGLRLVGMVPFAATLLAMFLMYVLIPNCRVRWRHALIGALLAALLFELARKGFGLYVHHVASYREIYGALAAIPIFLIWIYLSWVIVLLGATLTAALNGFEYRHKDELLPPRCEFIGLLRVLQHFVIAQREGRGLTEAAISQRERFLRGEMLQRYLDDLQGAGLVRRTEAREWVLARDLDGVTLADLLASGDYRLPADAVSLQRAAAGLPQEARVALQRAEAGLRESLAVSLRSVFVAQDSDVLQTNSGKSSP
ncbi:MAG TPA: YihY family inner membrane protein [Rhodanobacteraceae bacterium]|nr:YihY family inner membrane protein [Rhodanobacteraceae bacterium]